MLKQAELATKNSCLNKADSNEPIFVLRAKDPFAAMAVRHWAVMAAGRHEDAKVAEAMDLASQMDIWRSQRFQEDGAPLPEVAAVVKEHRV